jgi:hypothetical protein
MKKNVIKFIANRHWLTLESNSKPQPTIKNTPEWYKKANKYKYNLNNDQEINWKSCPALMDAFGSGYVLKTPCDITFYIDEKLEIDVDISDKKYKDFCQVRYPMTEFVHPAGYHEKHFAWHSDWGLQTPKGYSCLYITPVNRFDLPFINTIGIIDTDELGSPGSLPFFIINGWTGTIPAGTPYVQIIPFKRENWESEYVIENASTIYGRIKNNILKFRIPSGGVYKKQIWKKKEYK